MHFRHGVIALTLTTSFALPMQAADWPQWMGPKRDGVSPETGLLKTWPADGPKVVWKADGGEGYSTLAVVGNRAFTLLQREGSEFAVALDAADGKQIWQTRLGPAYKNNYGNGPRSTPTVDGKLIYVQSVTGPLACLNSDSGDIVWQKHLLKDFKAKNISWGLSASPLIEGDRVIALAGDSGGIVAFDKATGTLAWKSTSDKAAYSSPIAITSDGRRQVLCFTAPGVVAVAPKDGTELWRIDWPTEYDCNIATPLIIGDTMFISSGEKNGCALYQLTGSVPKLIWESKGPDSVMTNYWATSVVHDGHLYGPSGEFSRPVSLNCVELKSGKLKWSQPNFGLTSVTLADGNLFLVTKKGDLVLAEASPAEYREKGRLTPLGNNYTAGTVANGRLYVRDERHILCLDLKGK